DISDSLESDPRFARMNKATASTEELDTGLDTED
ncbi:MAG: SMC-Scp complex subunit ScpB, partial [Rhodococcus sp. (in: high G+C Gram-positive bacteria)]